ncbi:MAG: SDR family NAD(P)-dependent oxidoreductase [Deltaproteobacteria bacterium]|nr:SDR family NAD(P)-dependent oxidoreductase [Deltaproteobacteria bacterium]
MRFDNKCALVTGGGSGIGRAVCLAFAREGADVGVVDVNLEGAEATAQEVRKSGRKAAALQVDVADPAAVHQPHRHVPMQSSRRPAPHPAGEGRQDREPGLCGWPDGSTEPRRVRVFQARGGRPDQRDGDGVGGQEYSGECRCAWGGPNLYDGIILR